MGRKKPRSVWASGAGGNAISVRQRGWFPHVAMKPLWRECVFSIEKRQHSRDCELKGPLQEFGFDHAAILPPARHRTAPRLTPLRWLSGDLIAMITEELATLFVILSYFVGFIAGLFVGLKYRKNKARIARPPEGKLRHEGIERSIIALIIVLVVVSVVSGFSISGGKPRMSCLGCVAP